MSKSSLLSKIDLTSLPSTYTSNTSLEDTIIEYVESFRRKYISIYSLRKDLILFPLNECNIRKFICTTLHTCQIPLVELNDIKLSANFVADYFQYIPLDNPIQLPDLLISPTTSITLKTGDCLDLSTILCSILKGSGYDSYVVSGYAPLWICKNDQTNTEYDTINNCAIVEQINWNGSGSSIKLNLNNNSSSNSGEHHKREKYTVEKKSERISKFAEIEEKRRLDLEQENLKSLIEEQKSLNLSNRDSLWGHRVHVWVLVRKNKRQPFDVFIEPSSGAIYPVSNSPYLGIESIWNEKNYYVNVQNIPTGELQNIQFDLYDTNSWEYILMEDRPSVEEKGLDDDLSETIIKVKPVDNSKVKRATHKEFLDLSPSWSNPLIFVPDAFIERYPSGNKIIEYLKCRLTRYCLYYPTANGLTKKIELYTDIAKKEILETRETYNHRRDNLIEKLIKPREGIVVCHYAAGRSRGLESWTEYDNPRKRVFTFYNGSRIDGLIKREEIIGKKVMEYYAGRDNLLVYRSLTIADAQNSKNVMVQIGDIEYPLLKFAEKYDRNPDVLSEEDIRKITFFVAENKIRLDYHYGEDRVTASCRTYSKDTTEASGWTVDDLAVKPSRALLKNEFANLIIREKDTLMKIREHERTAFDLLQLLKRESGEVYVDKSVYDNAREKAQIEDKDSSDQKDDEFEKTVDVLYPFLQQFGNTARLTYDQAKQAHDECLRALRDRLLERAAIIQARLDDENDKLQKKQMAYQRQGHGEQEDEEMSKYYQEAIFKIQILKGRLIQHEKNAIKKYGELEHNLRKDHRLRILYGI